MNFRSKLSFFYRKATARFRRLPDFLVLGAQKCGTTFLDHCLRQHPDIAMGFRKEVHFFDSDHSYKKGVNQYKSFFPLKFISKNKRVGEITPRYILEKEVPERCKALLPHAKLIVVLRNPVTRTFSHYNMTKRKHKIHWTFEEYIQKSKEFSWVEIEKNGAKKLKSLNALKRGLYNEQIENWYQHYPKEQFLFLESEALFNNPHDELNKVYGFLGLSQVPVKDLTPKRTGGYREKINPNTWKELEDYFSESNEGLIQKGFEFSWLLHT